MEYGGVRKNDRDGIIRGVQAIPHIRRRVVKQKLNKPCQHDAISQVRGEVVDAVYNLIEWILRVFKHVVHVFQRSADVADRRCEHTRQRIEDGSRALVSRFDFEEKRLITRNRRLIK